jgi:hypothetical protein
MYGWGDAHSMLAASCPHGGNSATSCLEVTTVQGTVHWLHAAVAFDCLFSLGLDYDQSLSSAFAPVIAHIDQSWIVGRAMNFEPDAAVQRLHP